MHVGQIEKLFENEGRKGGGYIWAGRSRLYCGRRNIDLYVPRYVCMYTESEIERE